MTNYSNTLHYKADFQNKDFRFLFYPILCQKMPYIPTTYVIYYILVTFSIFLFHLNFNLSDLLSLTFSWFCNPLKMNHVSRTRVTREDFSWRTCVFLFENIRLIFTRAVEVLNTYKKWTKAVGRNVSNELSAV